MQNIYHDHRYATFASQPILETEMMEISTSNPSVIHAPPSVPSVVPAVILDSTFLAVSSSPPPIFVSSDMLTIPSSPPPITDVSGTVLFGGSMPSSSGGSMPGQRSSSGPSLLTISSSPPPICDVSVLFGGSMPSSSGGSMPGQRSSSGPSLLTISSSPPPICDVSGSLPSSSAMPGQRSSSGPSSSPSLTSVPGSSSSSGAYNNSLDKKVDILIKLSKQTAAEVKIMFNAINPRAGTTSRNTAITAIETKEELEAFNANLEVNTYMAEMLCSLLYAIDHIKYVKERLDKIIDLLFSREFLSKCSWSGIGRPNQKVAFAAFENVFVLIKFAGGNKFLQLNDDYVKKILVSKMDHGKGRNETKTLREIVSLRSLEYYK
ncbi:TSC22 domain family protein 1-like isoform X1 [Anopheles arabiensis]|uniref:TSC22 domain family protein 1-like isoform X1 n=1 Tax=Anopheles arabiensis TaxID=7173 RepID=UPI001AAC5C89|nr:TSC22 domain family protein 1-like isoform X1 [Anopheles arabiensis]XP_040167688.1 TSC22 domain family protein 1-like isoform X1 [Anopheles arabiensis]